MNTQNFASLCKKGLFYCFSIGTESLVAAALLPILTYRLSAADYGLWILFVSLFGFMRPVIGLMLQDAVRIRYFQLDEKALREHILVALLVPSMFFLVLLAISALFSSQIELLFSFPGKSFFLVLFSSYVYGILALLLAVIQFREKHRVFLTLQIIQTVVAIGLTLAFLRINVHWHAPVYARIIAVLLCDMIAFAFLSFAIGNILRARFSLSTFIELARNGLRLMPVGLAPVVIPLTDRLFVTKLTGREETGYFGIGALFGMSVHVLATGLVFAWQPILFRALQTRNEEELRTCRLFSFLYFFLLPIAGLVFSSVAIFLAPYLIGYEVQLVKPYIIALTVAVCCECYYLHNHTLLLAHRRIGIISLTALSLMILNALLCIPAVEHFGGIGAAWATAFTYLIATFGTTVYLRRL